MLKILDGRKSFFISLLMIVFLFFGARTIFAHNPHDIIEVFDISPGYDQDKTLFIAVLPKGLLKSTDGGFSWKLLVKGLDNKGSLSYIVISPYFQFDQTVFVSAKGDGVYRSTDGGASWSKLEKGFDNLNLNLLSISPDYQADQTLLAADDQGGLYRTKNRGERWYRVVDNGSPITAVAFFAARQENLVLAGDRSGRLYLSTDKGENWQEYSQFSEAGAITSIAISPNILTDGTLFVSTEKKGVLKSVDGGVSFVAVNNGLTNGPDEQSFKYIRSLAISPDYETDATIFASTWYEGVFQSNNGGDSWQLYNRGLSTDKQADTEQYMSPHFRDLRISKSFGRDRTVFVAGFDGFFKSTEGGHIWTQMETLHLGLVAGGLTVSPGDEEGRHSIAVVTTGGILIANEPEMIWAIRNVGLSAYSTMDVAFSPSYQSDNIVYSAGEHEFGISRDRGNTWHTTELAYQESWTNPILRRVLRKLRLPIPNMLRDVNPKPDFIVISPDFDVDKTIYFGTRYDGVYRSVDGGRNWSALWQGHQVSSLVISPDFPSDRTLFVSDRNEGVYKTVDGGDTWQPANNGLTFITDDRWQSVSSSRLIRKNIELTISPVYNVDQTVFAGSAEGLFKTTDGGASWQKLEILSRSGYDYILAMAISPVYKHDQTILVSVKGRGLFRSDDSGLTFVETGSGLIDKNYELEMIEFSPSYAIDQTIYGASREEVFQSIDGGHTWKILPRPRRYEETRDTIQYEGKWTRLKDDNFSTSGITYSNEAHSKAVFKFVGTGITWLGTTSNDEGIAMVYIDGDYKAKVDQFSDTRETVINCYSIADLAHGPHTVTIEVTGTKHPQSIDSRIAIDAFDVMP